jgi:hypothetical protein
MAGNYILAASGLAFNQNRKAKVGVLTELETESLNRQAVTD